MISSLQYILSHIYSSYIYPIKDTTIYIKEIYQLILFS